jgi:hypothetical protein
MVAALELAVVCGGMVSGCKAKVLVVLVLPMMLVLVFGCWGCSVAGLGVVVLVCCVGADVNAVAAFLVCWCCLAVFFCCCPGMGDGCCCAVLCGCVGGAGVLLAVLGLYCAGVVMFVLLQSCGPCGAGASVLLVLQCCWCWCCGDAAAELLVLMLWCWCAVLVLMLLLVQSWYCGAVWLVMCGCCHALGDGLCFARHVVVLSVMRWLLVLVVC